MSVGRDFDGAGGVTAVSSLSVCCCIITDDDNGKRHEKNQFNDNKDLEGAGFSLMMDRYSISDKVGSYRASLEKKQHAAILNRPRYANQVSGGGTFFYIPKEMMPMIDLVTSLLDCFVSSSCRERASREKNR